MELSEEVKKKAEDYVWQNGDDYQVRYYAFINGYQQALKDVTTGNTSHWCDCRECLIAKELL